MGSSVVVVLNFSDSFCYTDAKLTFGSACDVSTISDTSKTTHLPWLTTVRQDDFQLVLRAELLELGLDIRNDEIGRVLDGEVGNQSDGEFTLDGARDDSLRSWCGW